VSLRRRIGYLCGGEIYYLFRYIRVRSREVICHFSWPVLTRRETACGIIHNGVFTICMFEHRTSVLVLADLIPNLQYHFVFRYPTMNEERTGSRTRYLDESFTVVRREIILKLLCYVMMSAFPAYLESWLREIRRELPCGIPTHALFRV
jgi:hypothetical protein